MLTRKIRDYKCLLIIFDCFLVYVYLWWDTNRGAKLVAAPDMQCKYLLMDVDDGTFPSRLKIGRLPSKTMLASTMLGCLNILISQRLFAFGFWSTHLLGGRCAAGEGLAGTKAISSRKLGPWFRIRWVQNWRQLQWKLQFVATSFFSQLFFLSIKCKVLFKDPNSHTCILLMCKAELKLHILSAVYTIICLQNIIKISLCI